MSDTIICQNVSRKVSTTKHVFYLFLLLFKDSHLINFYISLLSVGFDISFNNFIIHYNRYACVKNVPSLIHILYRKTDIIKKTKPNSLKEVTFEIDFLKTAP